MRLKSSKNILIALIFFLAFFSDVKVNAKSDQDDLKNWFNDSFWYKSKGMMIFDKALCEVKKSKNKIPQDCKEKNKTERQFCFAFCGMAYSLCFGRSVKIEN